MRESQPLIDLATAHHGGDAGTPAGNARFTQEQYDTLRSQGISEQGIAFETVQVIAMPGVIPMHARGKIHTRFMPCPIVAIGPGTKRTMVLPNGKLWSTRRLP